jgi:hypothetical protein
MQVSFSHGVSRTSCSTHATSRLPASHTLLMMALVRHHVNMMWRIYSTVPDECLTWQYKGSMSRTEVQLWCTLTHHLSKALPGC